mmetsp:Transcript_35364/g.94782  ORF Transcript_35364/g.94782 Transcript_35364/m.94782 type:complete len:219 (-) Transcript_35364:436-1092(-)
MTIPLLIIANKYDIYKDMESVQKKTISQALRFVAHSNGATLLTVGARDKASQNNLRMQLTQLLFRTSSSKKVELTNHDKPMAVPAGVDSFDNILKIPPKGTDVADFVGPRSVNSDANVTWARVMEDMFGPKRYGYRRWQPPPSTQPITNSVANAATDGHNASWQRQDLDPVPSLATPTLTNPPNRSGARSLDDVEGEEKKEDEVFLEPAVDDMRSQRE